MGTITNKLNGTAAPTVTDDSSKGYGVGSEWYNAPKGSVYKCIDATVGAAQWAIVNVSQQSIVPEGGAGVGGWFFSHGIQGISTSAQVAGLVTFQPIFLENRVSVDALGIRTTGTIASAGVTHRLGLYRADPMTRLPGALIVDGGDKTLSAFVGDIVTVLPQVTVLDPGLIWTACFYNIPSGTAPTAYRVAGSDYGRIPYTGMDELASATAWRYISAPLTPYQALPASASALTYTRSNGTDGTIVCLRKS